MSELPSNASTSDFHIDNEAGLDRSVSLSVGTTGEQQMIPKRWRAPKSSSPSSTENATVQLDALPLQQGSGTPGYENLRLAF